MTCLRVGLVWALFFGALPAAQTVVVVLDDSGSMSDPMRSNRRIQKMDAAKDAMRTVLAKVPADAEVGVLAINDDWILPLGPVDRGKLDAIVQRMRANGGTPLGESMRLGADALLTRRKEQRYGDYRLLVITDGEANDPELVEAFLPDIMSRGITVDVVGVDMEADHSLATRVHTYRRADDPEALTRAIEEALAESDDSQLDGGESDFELLADFPAEVAAGMLTALSTQNDDPIVAAKIDDAGNRVTFTPVRNRGIGGGGTVPIVFGMCCLMFLVVTGVTLVAFLKAISRR